MKISIVDKSVNLKQKAQNNYIIFGIEEFYFIFLQVIQRTRRGVQPVYT